MVFNRLFLAARIQKKLIMGRLDSGKKLNEALMVFPKKCPEFQIETGHVQSHQFAQTLAFFLRMRSGM